MDNIIKAGQVKMSCSKQDDCSLVCGQCGCNETQQTLSTPKPYCCPVCTGSGNVPGGFYNRTSQNWTSCSSIETCRACNGTGVIWGKA